MRPLKHRLMDKIQISDEGCWEFTGARRGLGYGNIKHKGKVLAAHRVMWEISVSAIPNGMFVLHHCDNPPCCRPDHLFLGTHQDNSDDKISKGRDRKGLGERNRHAKLTASDVLEIRRTGGTLCEIAKKFGVSHVQISSIKRREHWKHI